MLLIDVIIILCNILITPSCNKENVTGVDFDYMTVFISRDLLVRSYIAFHWSLNGPARLKARRVYGRSSVVY
jgi:hypothetical protein